MDETDLGAVFDAHSEAEFDTHDLEATLATMSENPALLYVPLARGAEGRDAVRAFYRDHFIGKWPADTDFELISRTIGQNRLVEEYIIRFTHTVELETLLPGVAPTGKPVELPQVVVVGFEGGKMSYEHLYWDQASLLVQVGLLDPALLPVTGSEQAARLRARAGL